METAHDFTVRLRDLLRRERIALGDFLVALADLDGRRLWLDSGYASLFDYLRRELGLSKASAFYRMRAAQLLQRFPVLAEPLRDGRLCLTSVAELAKVATAENLDEVLPRFFQLSKQEARRSRRSSARTRLPHTATSSRSCRCGPTRPRSRSAFPMVRW